MAMSTHPQPNAANPQSRQSSGDSMIKEEDDELAALGGKTRLVPSQRKSPSLPSSPQESVRLHQTPSPLSSPVQPYTIGNGHSVQDHNGNHAMGPWQPYQGTGDEGYSAHYYPPTASSSHWQHDAGYSQMPQSMMMTSPVHYTPYNETLSPIGNPYMPAHSPVETQMQGDPQASWNNFYAQYSN